MRANRVLEDAAEDEAHVVARVVEARAERLQPKVRADRGDVEAARLRDDVEGGPVQREGGDLLDRVFGGSTESLVLRALSARPSSPEELATIRRRIDELEGVSS